MTIGTLPPRARDLLGLPWSRSDETYLKVAAVTVRALGVIPARWRYLPPAREGFALPRSTKQQASRHASPISGLPDWPPSTRAARRFTVERFTMCRYSNRPIAAPGVGRPSSEAGGGDASSPRTQYGTFRVWRKSFRLGSSEPSSANY